MLLQKHWTHASVSLTLNLSGFHAFINSYILKVCWKSYNPIKSYCTDNNFKRLTSMTILTQWFHNIISHLDLIPNDLQYQFI